VLHGFALACEQDVTLSSPAIGFFSSLAIVLSSETEQDFAFKISLQINGYSVGKLEVNSSDAVIADSVALLFEAWTLSARTLDRGFESRSGHVCLSLVFLCCVVLCR
jgi:hypothetical protein